MELRDKQRGKEGERKREGRREGEEGGVTVHFSWIVMEMMCCYNRGRHIQMRAF